jgi:hypothetical protein
MKSQPRRCIIPKHYLGWCADTRESHLNLPVRYPLLQHTLAINAVCLSHFSVIKCVILIFLLSYPTRVIMFKFCMTLMSFVIEVYYNLLVRTYLNHSDVFAQLMSDLLEFIFILHHFWCNFFERLIDEGFIEHSLLTVLIWIKVECSSCSTVQRA